MAWMWNNLEVRFTDGTLGVRMLWLSELAMNEHGP